MKLLTITSTLLLIVSTWTSLASEIEKKSCITELATKELQRFENWSFPTGWKISPQDSLVFLNLPEIKADILQLKTDIEFFERLTDEDLEELTLLIADSSYEASRGLNREELQQLLEKKPSASNLPRSGKWPLDENGFIAVDYQTLLRIKQFHYYFPNEQFSKETIFILAKLASFFNEENQILKKSREALSNPKLNLLDEFKKDRSKRIATFTKEYHTLIHPQLLYKYVPDIHNFWAQELKRSMNVGLNHLENLIQKTKSKKEKIKHENTKKIFKQRQSKFLRLEDLKPEETAYVLKLMIELFLNKNKPSLIQYIKGFGQLINQQPDFNEIHANLTQKVNQGSPEELVHMLIHSYRYINYGAQWPHKPEVVRQQLQRILLDEAQRVKSEARIVLNRLKKQEWDAVQEKIKHQNSHSKTSKTQFPLSKERAQKIQTTAVKKKRKQNHLNSLSSGSYIYKKPIHTQSKEELEREKAAVNLAIIIQQGVDLLSSEETYKFQFKVLPEAYKGWQYVTFSNKLLKKINSKKTKYPTKRLLEALMTGLAPKKGSQGLKKITTQRNYLNTWEVKIINSPFRILVIRDTENKLWILQDVKHEDHLNFWIK